MCFWAERGDVPQDRFTGATRLQREAVADLVANVDVHLVGDPEGQVHCLLSEGLAAHHHAMLEVEGQAVLGAPLGDLYKGGHEEGQQVLGLVRPQETLT